MSAQTYSAAQAATATGLPLKAVQKAIDTRAVPCRVVVEDGKRRRVLSGAALLCLRLEAEGLAQFPLELRRRIFRTVIESPASERVSVTSVAWIELGRARKALRAALNELKRAERMVASHPKVMGGAPVVRGTRVPVYILAEMRAGGASVEEILAGYPSVMAEQIALAEVYAKAHPKQGRPTAQPWAQTRPMRRTRKQLRQIV